VPVTISVIRDRRHIGGYVVGDISGGLLWSGARLPRFNFDVDTCKKEAPRMMRAPDATPTTPTDTLTGRGQFTVFAPTDEAFKKLPTGAMDALLKDSAKLKSVLNYHVVTGHILAKDVKAGEVITVQGSPLTAVVSSSGVQVNGARVKQADIAATNGVVHVIDAVIMPKNWQLLAAAA
jgi:Fasciclin domain